MSGPVQLFAVIALISLPTVMYGGYALLRLLKTGPDEFQLTNFRAGHAHAGVLLVMVLAALSFVDRTDLSTPARWAVCILLEVGVLAQAGGWFVHMAKGRPRMWSAGNSITAAGAVLLTAGLLILAFGVATA